MTTPHPSTPHDPEALRRCVAAVIAAEERDALRVAREALATAHTLLITVVQASPRPPGPLLEAAVAVGERLDALEDREAIEAAAAVLGHVWPRAGVRAALRRAVQVGAVTVEEIAAWVAAQSGGVWLEAESTLGALLDAVEAQESALAEAEAALEGEQVRAEGGERG